MMTVLTMEVIKWTVLVFAAISGRSSLAQPEVDGAVDRTNPDMPLMGGVIGGHEFAAGKWPWMVSLQGKIPDLSFFGIPFTYAKYYCGASLLNDRWILTAAHCFPTKKFGSRGVVPHYWHVRLGARKLRSDLKHRVQGLLGRLLDIDDWKEWYVHGEKIFVYHDYDSSDHWRNDIALVKLRDTVPVGSEIFPEIQSVTLPERGDTAFPADGARCTMVGWGCTSQAPRSIKYFRLRAHPTAPPSDCSLPNLSAAHPSDRRNGLRTSKIEETAIETITEPLRSIGA
ncbi:Acrosin [Lamellibrachia satsuma]|nr:Acrosin [Lamellibrachia satsuma]